MVNQTISPKDEIYEHLQSDDMLKIFLDSNVIIAYLDDSHSFNYEARTIIDPLKDRRCLFLLHYIVLGEFINRWVDLKKSSVKEAIKRITEFRSSLRYVLTGGIPMTQDMLLASFKRHAKHKNFIRAHFNDFIILAEAENIPNAKIVTCDKAMVDAGKSIFKKDIYYLPLKTSRGKSELTRFIADMAKIDF